MFLCSQVKHVTGGWRHTAAVTSDGRLFSWGWNRFGQLGLGHLVDMHKPTLVSPTLVPGAVAMVACGWRHTVAATESGAVYAWGRGVNGQLGLGINEDVYAPAQLQSMLCQAVKFFSKLS